MLKTNQSNKNNKYGISKIESLKIIISRKLTTYDSQRQKSYKLRVTGYEL